MIVYRCEDSVESIYTAVYQAYEERRNHRDTILCLTDDPVLFGEDVEVKADSEKTRRVMNTLMRRFGLENSRHRHLPRRAKIQQCEFVI